MHSLPSIRLARRFLIAPLAAVILLVSCAMPPVNDRAFSFGPMTINGRSNPLGIAADDISFAWATAETDGANARGIVQNAYRIRVGTTRPSLWRTIQISSCRNPTNPCERRKC